MTRVGFRDRKEDHLESGGKATDVECTEHFKGLNECWGDSSRSSFSGVAGDGAGEDVGGGDPWEGF